MKHSILRKALAWALVLGLLLPSFGLYGFSADADNGFHCGASATANGDGTYTVTMQAFQQGRITPCDIVMVLDVSGSMENSTPVAFADIDGSMEYYIRHERPYVENGIVYRKLDNIKVHNVAPAGETPQWFGQLDPNDSTETRVYPNGSGEKITYVFYTGAMRALRAAATGFVKSIAENADANDVNHRIAIVEFSSPVAKGDSALCTHSNPFYANILSGSQTAANALMDVESKETALCDILNNLTASGPTYSDDALVQAERILSAAKAEGRNQLVVLFTDGGPGSYGWEHDNDASSTPTANAAIASAGRMKTDGVDIYTIGVFNEENLAGATGEKNLTYLNAVSSNFPNAISMTNAGEQLSDSYCSIGDLNMDLSGVFEDISTVIGTPINSANFRETISKFFYLTAEQKADLLEKYPTAEITENADGTTTVSMDNIDFPPVATDLNGNAVNAGDAGIFTMEFTVSAHEELLGGESVSVTTGGGIFAEDGTSYATFQNPTVEVPINESALNQVLVLKTPTIYDDIPASVGDFYEDKSASILSGSGTVTYTVTKPDGTAFLGGLISENGDYTVTATITIGENTYVRSKTVPVAVTHNAVSALHVHTTNAVKTQYIVGESVNLSGITADITVLSGDTRTLNLADVTVSPKTFTEVGAQNITFTYEGFTQTIPVTVVEDYPTALLLTKGSSFKTSYFVGDTLDKTGLSASLSMASGKTLPLSVEALTFSANTLTTAGKKTVTVSYAGFSASFEVTVNAIVATKLEVLTLPSHGTYTYRRNPDFSGLTVKATYNNGTTETIKDTSKMTIKPTNENDRVRRGSRSFTVSFKGASAKFTMHSKLVWWQWIILIALFGWLWY